MRKLLVAAALVMVMAGGWSVFAIDYTMEGGDPGRTGWLKEEKGFTSTNVRNMKLLWKIKLDSPSREMHNLHPPLIGERVTTANGTREMAVVAGITDDLFGIDTASGEVVWHRRFDNALPDVITRPSTRTLCPGGQTATPAMAPGPTPGTYTIYAVSWDGRIRQVNLADGKDVAPAETFMGPNAKPYALNLHDGVIYTTNGQGCGGSPNAFYSYDLETKKASIFSPAGGGMWGRRGPSVSPEGVVYMGTGDAPFRPETRALGTAIVGVKLDANRQMQLVDYFAPPNANWLDRRDIDMNVSPVVFDYRGRKFLVGSSKECRLWLLDRDALGGEDHRTSLHTTDLICNDDTAYDAKGVWGAMAAWQDAGGQQWVGVPFYGPVSRTFKAPIEHARPVNGGMAAFRLVEQGGKWRLNPAWLSRDMDMGETALVAGDVVFVFGSGEDTKQTALDRPYGAPISAPIGRGTPRRIAGSTHITLYALNAATGQELWSSGSQITSFSHFSGITVANGRVYVPTFDGMLYCFGVR